MYAVQVILPYLARALVLTIAFEVPLSLFFLNRRTWRELLVVALAQVVTNPTVELVCIAFRWSMAAPLLSTSWFALAIAEVAAFVVEALLYRVSCITDYPWRMSAALNAASFGIGLLLGIIRAALFAI